MGGGGGWRGARGGGGRHTRYRLLVPSVVVGGD